MAVRPAPTNKPASMPQARPVSPRKIATVKVAAPQQQPQERNIGAVYVPTYGGGGGGGSTAAQETAGETGGGLSSLLEGNNKYIVIAVALLAIYFLFLRKKR